MRRSIASFCPARRMGDKPGPKGITPSIGRYISGLRRGNPQLSQDAIAARKERCTNDEASL